MVLWTLLPAALTLSFTLLATVKGKAQRETGSLLDNAIRENALLNVETLRNSELVLADLIKQNRLHVVGGLYDLATGPEWKF